MILLVLIVLGVDLGEHNRSPNISFVKNQKEKEKEKE
jgi:hypothetical protein